MAAGTVLLVGTSYAKVYANIEQLLINEQVYRQMAQTANPYGDGLASQRISEIVVKHLQKRSNVKYYIWLPEYFVSKLLD